MIGRNHRPRSREVELGEAPSEGYPCGSWPYGATWSTRLASVSDREGPLLYSPPPRVDSYEAGSAMSWQTFSLLGHSTYACLGFF